MYERKCGAMLLIDASEVGLEYDMAPMAMLASPHLDLTLPRPRLCSTSSSMSSASSASSSSAPASASSSTSSAMPSTPSTSGQHVCPVCSFPSKERLQFHFGALCCFSCRAFFRRANKDTRTPTFFCSKNGNCTVDLQGRRKCQKCRYERCIQHGMDPDLVLNDEQRRIRFRVMLSKREKNPASSPRSSSSLSSSSQIPAPSAPSASPDRSAAAFPLPLLPLLGGGAGGVVGGPGKEQPYVQPRRSSPPISSVDRDPGFWSRPKTEPPESVYVPQQSPVFAKSRLEQPYPAVFSRRTSNPGSPGDPSQSGQSLSISSPWSPPSPSLPVIFSQRGGLGSLGSSLDTRSSRDEAVDRRAKVSFISRSFVDAASRAAASSGDGVRIVNGDAHALRSEMGSALFRMALAFETFARAQDAFRGLPADDRAAMIFCAAPVFVAYQLCRFAGAASFRQQMRWLLNEDFEDFDSEQDRRSPFEDAPAINLGQTLSILGLSSSPSARSVFEVLSSDVCRLQLPSELTPLVAYAVLFGDARHRCSVNAGVVAQAQYIEAVEIIRAQMVGVAAPSTETLVRMLTKLSQVRDCLETSLCVSASASLSASLTSSSSLIPLPFVNLPLPVTPAEDCWLIEKELSWFGEAWDAVAAPEDLLTEYASLNLGCLPRRSFLPSLVRMFLERLRVMTRLQQDYSGAVGIAVQNETWCRNCLPAIALCLLRMESFATLQQDARKQINYLMGNFGWDDSVPFGMGASSLRPLRLSVADADANRMDARDEVACAGLARVLAPVLVTEAAFKLFMAVLLFDGGDNATLNSLQSKYIQLLLRRLVHENDRRHGNMNGASAASAASAGGNEDKVFDETAVRTAIDMVRGFSGIVGKIEH